MAEMHHMPKAAVPQARRYKMGYRPNGGAPDPLPQLTLKGQWLNEAGFTTGSPLDVQVLPGCLIVMLRPPEPETPAEPEVVTQLRQACKRISARKQQHIAEFITLATTPKKRHKPGVIEWRSV